MVRPLVEEAGQQQETREHPLAQSKQHDGGEMKYAYMFLTAVLLGGAYCLAMIATGVWNR